MKPLLYLIPIFIIILSCKKDLDPAPDYCADYITEFKKYVNYEGQIYFCNAQPPQQAFIPAIATTTFLDSNQVSINLHADSINFDTTLLLSYRCFILEEVFPNITLSGQTENDDGYFSQNNFIMDYTGSLDIGFGYPGCLNNTWFEGLGKY